MKVLRDDTIKKVSWENLTDWYIRVDVGGDDYVQALADDFKTIDSDGKMRIMSKPKPNDVVLSTNEASTNEQTVERKAADCGK